MAGKKREGPERRVEPVSLLGLNLGEDQPEPAPAASATAAEGPVLRLRLPDGRVAREPLLGGFWRLDRAGEPTTARVVTRREGQALACKLYRIESGRALYAGMLKAAGARAFAAAAPGMEFRYRNAVRRTMTAAELAAVVNPGRVYDWNLLGVEA